MTTYEIKVRDGGAWIKVTHWFWRSWTGRRRVDGLEYHGPIYALGTGDRVERGQRRACPGCDRGDYAGCGGAQDTHAVAPGR